MFKSEERNMVPHTVEVKYEVRIETEEAPKEEFVQLEIGRLSVAKDSLEGLRNQLQDCARRNKNGCDQCPVGPGNGCVNKLLLHASAALGYLIDRTNPET